MALPPPQLYAPLSTSIHATDTETFNIRLIKLQPSDDPLGPIHCKLFTYPLISHRSVSLHIIFRINSLKIDFVLAPLRMFIICLGLARRAARNLYQS